MAVECKAGKNTPTALQLREIAAINTAGGIAVVVNEDNIEMVRDYVRNLKRNI